MGDNKGETEDRGGEGGWGHVMLMVILWLCYGDKDDDMITMKRKGRKKDNDNNNKDNNNTTT